MLRNNPLNKKSTIQIISNGENIEAAADGSHGWLYRPSTLTFMIDSSEVDEKNKPYRYY